jgi:hypothetical protein
VSLSRPWILVFSLTLAACGGGGGDGSGDGPDAAIPDSPDAGSTPGAPDGGAVVGAQCESYCGEIMTNCTGDNAQYQSMDECLALCGASGWSEGAAGAAADNTLNCRFTHAGELAASDPDQHCASAGPTGGGVCGSLCESYCAYSAKHCGEVHSYRDTSQCVLACDKLIPQDGDGTADDNSVQCRLRNVLEAARGGDAEAACAAADLHGNDTCGSWCEVYCHLMDANCSDQPVDYPDVGTCLSACGGFATDGNATADMGDNVQCRVNHAGLPALRNPALECGHAAESSTNYCINVSPI